CPGRTPQAPSSAAPTSATNITVLKLLPLALLVVFTIRKVPPFLAILGSALFAGIFACFTQWSVVKAFVDEPGRSAIGIAIKGIYAAMATGFVSKSGLVAIDTLFSRGGMASLLTTIRLVLAALSFGRSWSTRASWSGSSGRS